MFDALGPILFAQDSLNLNVFDGIEPEKRFVIILAVIGCVTGIIITTVVTISSAVSAMARNRGDAELKRDMLDRGLSAEEIEKIIRAASPEPQPGTTVNQTFVEGNLTAPTSNRQQ